MNCHVQQLLRRETEVWARKWSLLVAKLENKVLAQIKQGNVLSIKIAELARLHKYQEDNGILYYTNF